MPTTAIQIPSIFILTTVFPGWPQMDVREPASAAAGPRSMAFLPITLMTEATLSLKLRLTAVTGVRRNGLCTIPTVAGSPEYTRRLMLFMIQMAI